MKHLIKDIFCQAFLSNQFGLLSVFRSMRTENLSKKDEPHIYTPPRPNVIDLSHDLQIDRNFARHIVCVIASEAKQSRFIDG